MIRRETPIVIPEKKRYWKTTVEGHGDFHFRFPTYVVGAELINLSATMRPDGELTIGELVNFTPTMGVTIGTCWFNEHLSLEPRREDESLDAFGSRVCDELQEEDLDILDILQLFNTCSAEIIDRNAVNALGRQKANFTPPPEGEAPPTS